MDDRLVPASFVDGKTLKKVLDYVKKHNEIGTEEGEEGSEKSKESEDDLKAWFLEYLKGDLAMLLQMLEVRHFCLGRLMWPSCL